MKKPALLAFLFGTIFTFTFAQKHYVLTLDQSLELALKQGYAVQNATSQYLASKKGYESALRRLRTSIDLNVEAPTFSESLTSQFNPLTQRYEFYELQTTRFQTGLTINQPLVFSGGTLTLRESVFGRDQISGLGGSASTSKDFFNNFLVEYRQPLLTPNMHRINSDKAAIGLDQVESDFLRNQLDVIYTVTESFFSLYQLAQRVEISREQVKQNQESYETAKNKYGAGLIPEVEVLQSEVDLVTSQNELLNAQREVERAKNAFRLLVGLSSADDVDVIAAISYQSVPIDSVKAIDAALENRSEVLNASRNRDLRQMDIDVASARNDFRMDLTATYGFNRNDTELSRVWRDFGTSRSASLGLSIPLFDWGSNRLEVEAAEIQHRNAIAGYEYTRQQVRQEIIDLLNRIKVAESRIQVLEKVVAVAQKSYDISISRFSSGTINRNDLAQAQQRLTAAKINNLGALIDYRIGIADLKRKTLFDFEKNEPAKPLTFDSTMN